MTYRPFVQARRSNSFMNWFSLKLQELDSAAELVRITYEDVAQSVEHMTFNHGGVGSIPTILTTYSHLQQLFSGSM